MVEFALGNKVMVGTVNGNREYFEAAMRDLAMAEAQYSGWVARLRSSWPLLMRCSPANSIQEQAAT